MHETCTTQMTYLDKTNATRERAVSGTPDGQGRALGATLPTITERNTPPSAPPIAAGAGALPTPAAPACAPPGTPPCAPGAPPGAPGTPPCAPGAPPGAAPSDYRAA